MSTHLDKLLSVAGEPLVLDAHISSSEFLQLSVPSELSELLRKRNGFFAFEAALCLFPIGLTDSCYGFEEWNSDALWKSEYDNFPGNCICFAEDLFGLQFCMSDGFVLQFDPETADFTKFSNNLEEWASKILDDYEFITGYPLAHDWQVKYGVLKPRHRLIPATPFVCGGDFGLHNLLEMESARGMRFRAELARQIHDLPDGAKIEFKIVP